MYTFDTIAAVATPPGTGGVGIIRVSGSRALDLGGKLFQSPRKKTFSPGRMYYGAFSDGKGQILDKGLFVWFKSPRSFTGEDVVEFHCHGGMVVLQSLLNTLFDLGIRQAEPGEFSKRAFLNGRIDLAQAEAIAALIESGSRKAAAIASSHLQGKLSASLEQVREEILSVLAWVEAEIDYPEADIDRAGEENAQGILARQVETINGLQNTYREGKAYREGVTAGIIGSPNVGKSSLLNLLAGEEKAIVTDIPGTTRDVLQVPVIIRGIPLHLADTAGIRQADDIVESIGVERAQKLAQQADLILLILDTSRPLSPDDEKLLDSVHRDKTVVVLNKTDLPAVIHPAAISQRGFARVVNISALMGQGVENLKDEIAGMFISGKFAEDTVFLNNQRHFQALLTAGEHLRNAATGWDTLPLDILAYDLRQAWQALGEITGALWTEDLLAEIFQRFCLGK